MDSMRFVFAKAVGYWPDVPLHRLLVSHIGILYLTTAKNMFGSWSRWASDGAVPWFPSLYKVVVLLFCVDRSRRNGTISSLNVRTAAKLA